MKLSGLLSSCSRLFTFSARRSEDVLIEPLIEPEGIYKLSQDLILFLGDFLDTADKLSLMRVDRSFYSILEEDWMNQIRDKYYPDHHDNMFFEYRLSLRKAYDFWINGSEQDQAKLKPILRLHPAYAHIRPIFRGGNVGQREIVRFVDFKTRLNGGEALQIMLDNYEGMKAIKYGEIMAKAVSSRWPSSSITHLAGQSIIDKNVEKTVTGVLAAQSLTVPEKIQIIYTFMRLGCTDPALLYHVVDQSYKAKSSNYIAGCLDLMHDNYSTKLKKDLIGMIQGNPSISEDLMKRIFRKCPDYKLFLPAYWLQKSGCTRNDCTLRVRWSTKTIKEVLMESPSSWCLNDEALDFAFGLFRTEKEISELLVSLGKVDRFAPSARSLWFMISRISDDKTLELIMNQFLNIYFWRDQTAYLIDGQKVSEKLLERVYEKTSGETYSEIKHAESVLEFQNRFEGPNKECKKQCDFYQRRHRYYSSSSDSSSSDSSSSDSSS